MEFHDGRPVTRNQAWFRKRLFDVPLADAHWLAEDTLQLWLVLGVSRDSSYAKRRDEPESKTRTCIIDIDSVTALSGELRDQAAAFVAGGERVGELTDQAADLELDRLRDYLVAWFPNEMEEPESKESTVDAAIRLLQKGGLWMEAPTEASSLYRPGPADTIFNEDVAEAPEPVATGPKAARFRPTTEEVQMPTGEVVGSIYSHKSNTRALIDEAFGDA